MTFDLNIRVYINEVTVHSFVICLLKVLISILVIISVATMALSALIRSGSCIHPPIMEGTICHDTPILSMS